jgi:hypothetical protein
MSFPQYMQLLGIAMPTPLYLAGLLLFGVAGLVGWRHGRKAERPAAKWLGLALMLYPYATPQTWLLYLVGAVLCVWLYFAWG